MRFVLDASVALAWFIDHPVPAYAVRIKQDLERGGQAVVPALWRIEVPNGFIVAERRGLMTSAEAVGSVQKLELLLGQSIVSVQDPVSMRRVLTSARQHRLTAYDACYLDLAQDLQLPIATLDRQLEAAAKQAGVSVV